MKLIIKDGIVQDLLIDGIPIEKRIIKQKTKANRPGTKLRKYSGVCIHDTANANRGADARMHAKYVQSIEDGASGHQASYHFCVDDQRIVQILPTNEVAWHAGDGSNGRGNNEFVAIEICENSDGNRTRAERNAQVLAAALLRTLGGTLAKHQDFSGKYCPNVILGRRGWEEWKGVVMGLVNAIGEKIKDQRIMGGETVRMAAVVAWIKSKVAEPKLTCSVEDLVRAFYAEGAKEGVRPELAICLSIHETGWWRYGGIVQPDQNNFGGLAAFNGNKPGDAADFPDCQTGARAVVQHLKGYATTSKLNQVNVDPRYQALIDKGYLGKAPTIHGLSGKWAWPGYNTRNYKDLNAAYQAGETYGQSITKLYDLLVQFDKTFVAADSEPVKGKVAVFALHAADMSNALRIVNLVPNTVLIDSRAGFAGYTQVLQVGGGRVAGVTKHLAGPTRYETDAAVTKWINENQ